MKYKINVAFNFSGEVEVEAETPEQAIDKLVELKLRALPDDVGVTADYFYYENGEFERNTTIFPDGRRIDYASKP